MAHMRITQGDGVPPATGPYSPGVVAGDTCYVSGQIAVDPQTGRFRPGTIAEETAIAVSNLLAIARVGGFAPADFVSVAVALADLNDSAAFNAVYSGFWPADSMPSRITYEVGRLPLDAKVEVQGVAVRQTS